MSQRVGPSSISWFERRDLSFRDLILGPDSTGACVVSRLEPCPRYPRRGLCIRWISIVRALDVPARSKTIAARDDAAMASQGVGDVYYARTIRLHRCACGCL